MRHANTAILYGMSQQGSVWQLYVQASLRT